MIAVKARCIEAPMVVSAKKGERLTALFEYSTEQYRVWSPVDHRLLSRCVVNGTYSLAVSEDGKTARLLDLGQTPLEERIERYIADQAAVYQACYQKVRESMPELDREDLRAIATSVYIQTNKKFNL